MKPRIKNILILFSAAILSASPFHAGAQQAKVSISVTVTDEYGNPVSGAEFSIGEGGQHLISDDKGNIWFSAAPKDMVSVTADGYSPVHLLAGALADSEYVTLYRDDFLAGVEDDVPLPYIVEKKRNSLGNTVVLKGEDLEKYSSSDIRNMLTGIAPGVEVTENYGGPGVSPLEHTGQYGASVKVGVTTRGRQMIYMVDDIPVQINETVLDPQQIESITIVRDALEKNIYGPSAANGIVYIKTKRGKYNDRYLNVDVEGGISMTDRFPEYADGAEYASLNNIARNNDGMELLYRQSDIDAYRLGNPYDLRHPSVNYRDMILKNTAYYTKASISSGGGNDNLRYYAYLGYTGEDDLYRIGAASDYNRVNINANLDIKLHRYINARFGIISTMGVRRSPNYGYNDISAEEFPDMLSDINTIPPVEFPVYAADGTDADSPWYAVSSQYTDNPIANMVSNGSYTETIRKGLMNVGVDVDFSFLTEGLKSKTYAAFDATNLVRLGMESDYAAYILTEGLDASGQVAMVPRLSGSHSLSESAEKSKILDYFSNRLYLSQNFTYDRTFGQHDVSAYASYMITKRSQKWITEHRREINFGLGGSYVYANKYIAQFTANYHGTYSLLRKWSFSPTVGFGWVMSEEGFMEGAEGLDFLKLRVQGGMLNYDSATSANRDVDNYDWDESGQNFGPHENNQWFGGTTSVSVDRLTLQMLGNPNLRLERRYEATAGLDLVALDKRLSASLNYYYTFADGPITELENIVPYISGVTSGTLWMNYEQTRYHGYEISLGWKDRSGDFSYSVNGWASGRFSEVVRADELKYKDAYRSKVGHSASAIYGLKYIGKFQTDEETMEVPQLFDDTLVAGDLKYQDMNGDGIVDDNDVCIIGDSEPKLIYGLSVNLKYGNFDLTVVGTGRAFYDRQLTNSFFWNGWGDGNYSQYTIDNLINNPEHPRLTYNKVNNNYKTSSYWLAPGGFFKVQTLELGYEFPMRKWKIDTIRRIRLYLRGNNLCTLTGIEYVDPESMSAGVTNYPLMRTFVAGIKLTF